MSCFTVISLPHRLLRLSLGGDFFAMGSGRGLEEGDEGCVCHALKPQMKMKCELYNSDLCVFAGLN